ncbi:MAG: FHA domain-containing protein [Muribaculaceae bacterium]|nr:FHA domain-containing protein [Muribaculaceae bacterium]
MPIKIKCSKCGKALTVNTHDKAGTFRVKCPECGTALKFSVGQPKASNPAGAPQPPRGAGVPQPPVIGKFEVSKVHDAVCPVCGRPTKVELTKCGPQVIKCGNCESFLTAEGYRGTVVLGGGNGVFTGDMRRGIIRVHKSGLGKMFGSAPQMMLRPGSNIIGRYDSMAPSDFSLNDRAVSRRSVEIFVDSNPVDGITFKLTVLKAANPVYHNGRPMNVGDALALKFGDTIRLGTTTLDFIPEHK